MYDLSVTIHVLAAIIGFGATFTYPVIELAGRRAGGDAVALALGTITLISRRVAVPAAAVVGATGVYQVIEGPFSAASAWLSVSIALYVGIIVVATVTVAPAYERARRAAERMAAARRPPDESAEYVLARRLLALVGPGLAIAIVAVIVLMVLKPG